MTIRIFTKPLCPYCSRAKGVFKRRGIPFQEILGAGNPDSEAYVLNDVRKATRRDDAKPTWPQVYVGDTYIGGSDDLAEWDADGRLDALMNGDK